ncbi:ABC transporter related [Halorhabdus utahensis DSM 12940]|uniref:ABC transporter related n=1 Tax=Halorhabdus utahensis (strain DSM 12940 / JCM 11049 / AX-2) TaxID=519442 RepID=C7NVB9_HALUD|nr:ABC transporter ATP-binding protein [Halorhabdus utahensis]ACV11203.1 ABC transporter related [Halorhabdus utahensis DSM 12940]
MSLALAGIEATRRDFSLGPLSLSVEDGVTAVLGPSGAGKSTLLEVIAGFETPESGTVSLAGTRIDGLPPEERNVGMVFQDAALFPHLSVAGNLRYGAPEGADIERTVRTLGIGDLLDRDPTTLSGGERRRVALARTLVTDPDALVLDEPLSSLDAPIRRRLRLDLRDILSGLDVPVVYVTHDQEEAAVVADRVAVLFDGTIRQAGPVGTVFDDPATPTVARFLGVENLLEGTVRERRDGEATTADVGGTTVEIGGTTLRVADRVETGIEQVVVGFRPTAIEFANGANAENTLDVEVERVVPGRDGATVVLAADGLGRLTARTAEQIATGDRRSIAIDPTALHIFPDEPNRCP